MKKILYLEGLRGYMSLWVFLTHALTLATFPFNKEYGVGRILVNGYWPVCIFIILSGFVTHILLEKEESYSKFIFRRAFRLFPVYLFCFTISLGMIYFTRDVLSSIPWENAKNIERIDQANSALETHFSINAISHYLLLHGLVPQQIIPAAYTIMGQSWSLTLEWQFYLVIPIFYNLLNNRYNKTKSIIITTITGISILFSNIYMPQKTFLPNLLYLFAIGYFTYYFFKKEVKEGKKNNSILFIVLISLFCLYSNKDLAIITLLWLFTIYFQLHPNKLTNFIFTNKLIMFIGKVSYSLYCIHMIILILTVYFLINIIKIDIQNYYRFCLIIISIPISLIVSHFTYKYIELPFMNYAKRR